jgi:hypothetical protein
MNSDSDPFKGAHSVPKERYRLRAAPCWWGRHRPLGALLRADPVLADLVSDN